MSLESFREWPQKTQRLSTFLVENRRLTWKEPKGLVHTLRKKFKPGPSRSIEGILIECQEGTRKILPEGMRTESAVMDMFYTRLNLEMAVDGWWSKRVVELLRTGRADEIHRVELFLKE